jgi:hypothetical protein
MFENLTGDTPDVAITNKLSFKNKKSEEGKYISHLNNFLDEISNTLQDNNSHINIKAVASDFPFALDIDIESENLGQAFNLALKSIVVPYI